MGDASASVTHAIPVGAIRSANLLSPIGEQGADGFPLDCLFEWMASRGVDAVTYKTFDDGLDDAIAEISSKFF